MTNLPMFPEHSSENDDTPLPLIVAKTWNFPLAFHLVEGQYLYAIQDWVRGLLEEDDIRKIWTKFKTQKAWKQMSTTSRPLPYKASDGKTYKRDHTIDKGLFIIAQYLRPTEARPVLDEIRKYLANAGAFVDEVRRDPSAVLTSGAMTPDQAIDAGIEMYRAQGKSDAWIQMRVQSKIKRDEFTRALGQAIAELLNPSHYAIATNDMYRGLWGRTAAHLKQELSVPKNGSLRDHQPTMALYFQGIAEEGAAHELGEKQEVSWAEARDIVRTMAEMIQPWIQQMSTRLKMDIATGRPLLPASRDRA